jgi:hypothetical protein
LSGRCSANKGKHMIGKGPGAYFTLRMATHISRILGTDPVIYDATRYNIPGNSITSGPIPAAKLPAGLASSGWKTLRLVVLYDEDRTAGRILNILEVDYGVAVPPDLTREGAVYDGASVEGAQGITVVMCKAPDITMHGTHDRGPSSSGSRASSPRDPTTSSRRSARPGGPSGRRS